MDPKIMPLKPPHGTSAPNTPAMDDQGAKLPAQQPPWARSLKWLVGLVALLVVREAQVVLLPITIAVALMFVLTGPVQRLRRLGIPEAWGAGIVVSILLVVVALMGTGLAGPAAQWAERAPTTVKQLLDTLDKVRVAVMPPGPHRTQRANAAEADAIKDKLATEGILLTRVVIGQFFHFTLSLAATIILLYFLLASQPWLLSRTLEAVRKPRSRLLVLSGIRQAQRDIGLYLGTMGLINVGLGFFTGVALAFIGLPNPVLWGTVVAVINFIPYLGPALVTAMLLVAGSMTFGPGLAMLAPPAAFLACHGIEANFVSPWIMGHRLRLSPLSVFLCVMVWGWIWGFGGTLVAVPLLLGFRAFCRRHPAMRHVCHYLEGGRKPSPSVRTLLRPRDKAVRSTRIHSHRSQPDHGLTPIPLGTPDAMSRAGSAGETHGIRVDCADSAGAAGGLQGR